MNILLVEDDKNICEMVCDFLKSENYNVITAIDGKMAIDIFKEHTFDIVLLDLMLPKSSGLEVLILQNLFLLLNYWQELKQTYDVPQYIVIQTVPSIR